MVVNAACVQCVRGSELVTSMSPDRLDLVRKQRRDAQVKWRKEHAGKWNAICATHWADKLSATPAWADADAISAAYEEAERLTVVTGKVHHVDHMVPLRSKLVCGLHVQDNLRPLLGADNIRKSNRHWLGSNGWLLPLRSIRAATPGIVAWERERSRGAPWVAAQRCDAL